MILALRQSSHDSIDARQRFILKDSLGLIDADYCLWNGLAMRSCCVTLDTVSSHKMEQENVRKKECIHVCVAGSPCCMTEEKIMHWEIKTK